MGSSYFPAETLYLSYRPFRRKGEGELFFLEKKELLLSCSAYFLSAVCSVCLETFPGLALLGFAAAETFLGLTSLTNWKERGSLAGFLELTLLSIASNSSMVLILEESS